MFLARHFRARRVLSVGAAGVTVLATTLVAAVPAQADDVYPRPWDSIVTLSGHGYGHGHGMSQWGANGAAEVRDRAGHLWMYPGDGVGGVLPPTLVGSGWNTFSTVLP